MRVAPLFASFAPVVPLAPGRPPSSTAAAVASNCLCNISMACCCASTVLRRSSRVGSAGSSGDIEQAPPTSAAPYHCFLIMNRLPFIRCVGAMIHELNVNANNSHLIDMILETRVFRGGSGLLGLPCPFFLLLSWWLV